MNPRLTKRIFDDFPDLFPGNLMFGIECGDGWFEIIYDAIKKIDQISKEHECNITISQIKEKFGTLRIYQSGPDEAEKFVDEAEYLSGKTCELCGDKAVTTNHEGWVRTYCEAHEGGHEEPSNEMISKLLLSVRK